MVISTSGFLEHVGKLSGYDAVFFFWNFLKYGIRCKFGAKDESRLKRGWPMFEDNSAASCWSGADFQKTERGRAGK